MKSLLAFFALVFSVGAFAFDESNAALVCSGSGYTIKIEDDGYTYYADGQLTLTDSAKVDLSCGMYTGEPNSSWDCASEDEKYTVVVYEPIWADNITAKLKEGTKLLADMTCKLTR